MCVFGCLCHCVYLAASVSARMFVYERACVYPRLAHHRHHVGIDQEPRLYLQLGTRQVCVCVCCGTVCACVCVYVCVCVCVCVRRLRLGVTFSTRGGARLH